MTQAAQPTIRSYDVIVFGDEVPGVLAIVCAAKEYKRLTGKTLRTLVMSKANLKEGIGGHLVRGGLAYLDRCNVTATIRQSLGLSNFGDPSAIYKDFLKKAGVKEIALDSQKADAALRSMLFDTGTHILSRCEISTVIKKDNKITGIQLTNRDTYLAQQFIDCSVNAELAQFAGVKKIQGFDTFGLADAELPVTLVLETQGLNIQKLRAIELAYLQRFQNKNDTEVQKVIEFSAGSNPLLLQRLQKEMFEIPMEQKIMSVGVDFIDIRSFILSMAYHAFRQKPMILHESGFLLDRGNIATLAEDRLSWNALLFNVNGVEAEALARGGAKPTAKMLEEIGFIEQWFKSIGATAVKPASELYIRHAGNIASAVEPLTGYKMLSGGVPEKEALGTFSYHFDVRGGIPGLGNKALSKGINSISFHTPPLFNIGIKHALVKDVANLAVVSPASGFEGYACAAGRIVEFNVAVGQAVGIAASLAISSRKNLVDISNLQIRQFLEKTRQLSRIYGVNNALEAKRIQDFETSMVVQA
jgi:FAD dependent oxidoreductase